MVDDRRPSRDARKEACYQPAAGCHPAPQPFTIMCNLCDACGRSAVNVVTHHALHRQHGCQTMEPPTGRKGFAANEELPRSQPDVWHLPVSWHLAPDAPNAQALAPVARADYSSAAETSRRT